MRKILLYPFCRCRNRIKICPKAPCRNEGSLDLTMRSTLEPTFFSTSLHHLSNSSGYRERQEISAGVLCTPQALLEPDHRAHTALGSPQAASSLPELFTSSLSYPEAMGQVLRATVSPCSSLSYPQPHYIASGTLKQGLGVRC